jgi:hypothetical protein
VIHIYIDRNADPRGANIHLYKILPEGGMRVAKKVTIEWEDHPAGIWRVEPWLHVPREIAGRFFENLRSALSGQDWIAKSETELSKHTERLMREHNENLARVIDRLLAERAKDPAHE